GLARDVENERAVLAHRVDQPVNDVTRGQIATELPGRLVERAQVVPGADARLRLPGMRQNVGAQSSLDVGDDSLLQMIRDVLSIDHAVYATSMTALATVVVIRPDAHPAPAEWQLVIVEVEQVGIVLIDQVPRTVVKVLDVRGVRQRIERVLGTIE